MNTEKGRALIPCSAKTDSQEGAVTGGATVIVGLGNEIAGDDGAGIRTARRLASLFDGVDSVDVVELPWAGLVLLDTLRGYSRAVLIDSLQTGLFPPGTVTRLRDSDLAGAVRLISYHDLNYPTVLRLAEKVGYDMPHEVYLLGIEGQCFDRFTETLSPPVSKGVERAAAMVYRLIGRWHRLAVSCR